MAFNPLQANLVYSPPNPSSVIDVVYDIPPTLSNVTNIQFLSLPSWLLVQNAQYSSAEDTIIFQLLVNEAYAASLTAGDYTGAIRVRFRANFGVGSGTVTSSDYLVSLEVIEDIPLTLSPTVLPFDYTIGGSTPLNQTLNITSDSFWNITVNQTWVTLSQSSGTNSGQVTIGVNPVGLTVGQYQAGITVTDNGYTKYATVKLNVSDGNTDVTYLYVSPQNLQFVSELGEDNTNTSTVSIDASASWTAVSSEDWLVISASSGTSGVSTITVSVDSDELTDLDVAYLASITFTQGSIQRIIYVELFLVEFFVEGIESETLYFADDRNYLRVTNVQPNMFLYLQGILNNGVQNVIYTLNAPYQNGLAKVLFGLETNVMLKAPKPATSFNSRLKNNISPVSINFSAFNNQLNTGSATPIDSWQNVKFLTGKTPTTTNKLCYVPEVINVTKDAILSFSVLNTDGITDIEVTGDVTATITTAISSSLLVYNAIVNLSTLGVVAGNAITITVGDLVVDVNIKENAIQSTIIAFENEWREYEFFECTGYISEAPTADATTTELQVEGAKHTKIVSIDSGKDYTINTGYILSQSEITWLAKMLDSRRVFIYSDGKPVEVILNTKTLKTLETRRFYESFNLKFTKAIVE